MNYFTDLSIKDVDQNLFSQKYLGNCLGCSSCYDVCCSYGCQADLFEVDRIISYANQLEAELGIPASRWFEDEITVDIDYPSGKFRRTRVYNNKCVFYKDGYRGCTLHRFSIEKGMDIHQLKPMVCCLFPVTWEKERLLVSDFLNELPCHGRGISVFEAQEGELRTYLGDFFVNGLERRQYK